MKKIIAVITAIICALCINTHIKPSASQGMILSVSDKSARAGEYANIDITLTNNPGISGGTLNINYNSAELEYHGFIAGDNFSSRILNVKNNPNMLRIAFTDDLYNNYGDGVLFALRFKIIKNTGADYKSPITVDYYANSVSDVFFQGVNFTVINGGLKIYPKITDFADSFDYPIDFARSYIYVPVNTPKNTFKAKLSPSTYISGDTAFVGTGTKVAASSAAKLFYSVIVIGDLNGDGKITSTDYMLLKRFLIKKQIDPIINAAADYNGDKKTSAADYVQLKRFLIK